MKTILWRPDVPMVSELGLVEVAPGRELTPEQHEMLVTHRLQELVDESNLTLGGLNNLIDNSLTPEGWTVSVDSLESAGMDIMASMATKLRMDGALISEPVTIPMQGEPDLQDSQDEMSVEHWLNLASMPLL